MKWINVNDKLPKAHEEVLVAYNNGYVCVDFKLISGGFALEDKNREVTHWMSLPKPPKIGK